MREIGSKVFVMIDNKISVDTIKKALPVAKTYLYRLKSTRSNSQKYYEENELFSNPQELVADLLENIKEK